MLNFIKKNRTGFIQLYHDLRDTSPVAPVVTTRVWFGYAEELSLTPLRNGSAYDISGGRRKQFINVWPVHWYWFLPDIILFLHPERWQDSGNRRSQFGGSVQTGGNNGWTLQSSVSACSVLTRPHSLLPETKKIQVYKIQMVHLSLVLLTSSCLRLSRFMAPFMLPNL